MADYQTLIVAGVSALFSGVGVGVTLRTDISWIKRILDQHNTRITQLEKESHG
ncbi:hypothetical protein [Vibrio quintilis]|uniref:Uncharacterized protein n=1 Tax=Vibrio quintilis TaxID=1117707 RepID=A0A1M7YPC7_9VIBR|nr:hypothetical protein [Vibrio quintilis]SHO54484.1 hypothetical protein VQ7734_00198 [Vibrio quintilis]